MSNMLTFVKVEDISTVTPEPLHVYYWEKGYGDPSEKHWKAYAYGHFPEDPYGIGIADNAWDAVRDAVEDLMEDEE